MQDCIGAIMIDERDSVATLTEDAELMELVEVFCGDRSFFTCALEFIPQYHKIAVKDIAPGEPVYKYGHPIGRAAREIEAGEHVHLHNLL